MKVTPIPTSSAVTVAETPGVPSAADTVIWTGEELTFIPFPSVTETVTVYVPAVPVGGVQETVDVLVPVHPPGKPIQA